jgi:hypothetical protein
MVGRLVEKKHIVIAREQCGKCDAPALTTREFADLGIPWNVGDKPGKHIPNPGVPRPHVLVNAADDCCADGQCGILLVGLIEHPDGHASSTRHASSVRLYTPGQQREKG